MAFFNLLIDLGLGTFIFAVDGLEPGSALSDLGPYALKCYLFSLLLLKASLGGWWSRLAMQSPISSARLLTHQREDVVTVDEHRLHPSVFCFSEFVGARDMSTW